MTVAAKSGQTFHSGLGGKGPVTLNKPNECDIKENGENRFRIHEA